MIRLLLLLLQFLISSTTVIYLFQFSLFNVVQYLALEKDGKYIGLKGLENVERSLENGLTFLVQCRLHQQWKSAHLPALHFFRVTLKLHEHHANTLQYYST